MTNRIRESAEPVANNPDYKGEISRKALPYIGGTAYQGVLKKTGTDSFSPANPHTFLRFEFQGKNEENVCFFFQNTATSDVTFLLGPVDRCGVRTQGKHKDSSLEISFSQTGEEWYVDRPVMGKLGKMLQPVEEH